MSQIPNPQSPIPNSFSRRELLRLAAAGVGSASLSGWFGALAARAAEPSNAKRRTRSCILLWMDGGPSHIETFDPKPDAPESIRGDLAAIATSVPGIQVGEKFPQVAQLMQHGAILRGMSTREADHGRARIYMHTGYRPGAGGVTYPGLGSTVSAELGDAAAELPNFVVTGSPLNKYDFLRDPGYRGPLHQPVVLNDLGRGLENSEPAVPPAEFDRRTALLERVEGAFARQYASPPAAAHQAGLASALKLIRSDKRGCFDLSQEPDSSRRKYGESDFGRGCLLARRLIEAGVAFVEVYLSNWDSHFRDVAAQTRTLMSQVDSGLSSLVGDLHERGLLDSTLVIWMGEFGRTPRVNTTGGRDHYAKAWSSVLFGGGIPGGQTVGATDAQGAEVIDRPIAASDFMATICRILGIDFTKEIVAPGGRPIRIVEKDERLIRELLG
ncbi:MAG TPA: DUF1501 domain-containing protein [Pirellulaceae bacterium]|nr:DUF1501 domain-containing protein [Pirellulaceae bacterium]